MRAFGQGKFVRVYDRQGKLDKCTLCQGKLVEEALSRKTCRGSIVKENLSRKHCQGKLVEEALSRKTCRGSIVKENLSRKHCQGKLVEEALSRKTCQEKNLLVCKGGFPLGEIFRPNRNFLLSYKHSDGTKQKSFEFEPGLNLNNRNFGSIEKFRLVENRLNKGLYSINIF